MEASPCFISSALRLTSSRKPSASTTSSTALPTAMASGLPPKVVPWMPVRHAVGGSRGGEARAHREAAADALGDRRDVGRDARPFMREELAGAADAALDLVEDQEQAVLVAELAQALQRLRREDAHAALALHGLEQDRRGLGSDQLFGGVDVVEGDLVEAVGLRAEAFEIFRLAAGGDRRQRAAVERALEGDGAEALGIAVDVVVAARRLDGALHRLGAGIGEEHLVGEGRGDQPLGEAALAGNLVEVGDVPELAGLLGQRGDADAGGCSRAS